MATAVYENWDKYNGVQLDILSAEDGAVVGSCFLTTTERGCDLSREIQHQSRLRFSVNRLVEPPGEVYVRFPGGHITEKMVVRKKDDGTVLWGERTLRRTSSPLEIEGLARAETAGHIVETNYGKFFEPTRRAFEHAVLQEAARENVWLMKVVRLERCPHTNGERAQCCAAFSTSSQTISVAIGGMRFAVHNGNFVKVERFQTSSRIDDRVLAITGNARMVPLDEPKRYIIETAKGRTWWIDGPGYAPLGPGDIVRPPRPKEKAQMLVHSGKASQREEKTNREGVDQRTNCAAAGV